MNKIAMEEWVAVGMLCIIFGGGITLLIKSMVQDSVTEDTLDQVVVRNPVDHTMVLIKHPPANWEFKHCTSTNKECGRFE